MTLEGRTVLLTGAGRGIGRALATRLLDAGVARIVAVGRDPAPLEALATAAGGRVDAVAADLAIPADVERLVAHVRVSAPTLSVLVHNAGVQTLTDFVAGDAPSHTAALRTEIEVNFGAVVALTCGLLPLLLAQPSAMIVNVTSGLALAPKKSSPVYCATKSAVRAFGKGLRYQAQDRAPHLRVVEALPPLVDTDMTRGRGRGKLDAGECARQIVAGMQDGRDEIYVGKSRLLRWIHGVSPDLSDRVMRNG